MIPSLLKTSGGVGVSAEKPVAVSKPQEPAFKVPSPLKTSGGVEVSAEKSVAASKPQEPVFKVPSPLKTSEGVEVSAEKPVAATKSCFCNYPHNVKEREYFEILHFQFELCIDNRLTSLTEEQ